MFVTASPILLHVSENDSLIYDVTESTILLENSAHSFWLLSDVTASPILPEILQTPVG